MNNKIQPLKILIVMREHAQTQRGGDTVVIERLVSGLKQRGHQVSIWSGESPKGYDIVHFVNLTSFELIEKYAKLCVQEKIPYVVTCLLEDWRRYFGRMISANRMLEKYCLSGQEKDSWYKYLLAQENIDIVDFPDYNFILNHASAIFASGESEEKLIKELYPLVGNVEVSRFAPNLEPASDGGMLFRSQYLIDDYILCVGRIEPRKNQLMLLKALEEVEIPVVFVTGTHASIKNYESLVKNFKRKGRTEFIKNLSDEMLASAYAGAKVHVLPSWYELPGLATLEAAKAGVNVVATRSGSTTDYLGEDAFYCEPQDPLSIKTAIMAAYYAPPKVNLKAKMQQYSWSHSIDIVERSYARILNDKGNLKPQTSYEVEYHRAIEESEVLMKQLKFVEAKAKLEMTLSKFGDSGRVYKNLGIVLLALNDPVAAEKFFLAALNFLTDDVSVLTGIAGARWYQGQKEQSYFELLKILYRDPNAESTLLFFVQSSYELGRLNELEGALRRYLQLNPTKLDFRFCLAGCVFKLDRPVEASGILKEILKVSPNHENAKELLDTILSTKQIEKVEIPQEGVRYEQWQYATSH
jgi:glycosyltransferase involved in cell wall biosynthesis